MRISLVAAIGENFELGGKGNLLWRLPNDLKRFKELTINHHVIMGRKTYDSLPAKFKPLPERQNIVVTENPNFKAEGCMVVNSVLEGIEKAKLEGEEELMVIGGAKIYNQTLPLANTLYITKVYAAFDDADVFFPDWNDDKWSLVSEENYTMDEKHAFGYSFLKFVRKT